MAAHPEVKVQLTGQDGSVYSVIGSVQRALRRAGLRAEAEQFGKTALEQHSYDDVLQLCMRTVAVS